MTQNTDSFDIFSSKIKPILFPLSSPRNNGTKKERNDFYFIGRRELIEKLKSWLIKEDSGNGVYLISGYRGMGKTSFVNKVLQEIDCDVFLPGKSTTNSIIASVLYCIIFILYTALFTLLIFGNEIGSLYYFFWRQAVYPSLSIILLGTCFFVTILFFVLSKLMVKIKPGCKNRIAINLNLGHEVIKERDVLALISKILYDKYAEYKSNMFYTHPIYGIGNLITKTFINVCVLYLFACICNSVVLNDEPWFYTFYITSYPPLLYVILVLLSFITFPITRFFLYYTLDYLSTIFLSLKSLPNVILKDFRKLNDRINAAVSDGMESKFSSKGFYIGKKGERSYPLAGVREIEQELIQLLNSIKRVPNAPRFIIVLDELDKIDGQTNPELEEKELLPEYENVTSGFPGGQTSRKRKQNALNLLANMKFFTSTAYVKFIFISGRELYDASLSDVSDREFAISSIFDGVIYVDSFLSPKNNKGDIASMTETYICRQLLPASFVIHKECQYDKKCQDYRKCKESCKHFKQQIDENNYSLKVYNAYLKNLYKDQSSDIKTQLLIDKAIIMLYHFSTYLTHISNGAPKKIATHFEKYTRNSNNTDEDIDILKSDFQNPTYLCFTYRDQQKINFIHYMSYPVLQAVINTSGNFGDKLLLSASFLTDHIYKHHKDGFAWRNLELVPELLDVNKTPELRSFIGSIIEFLKKTHLSTMYSGIYNLKFPQKVSEEISFFSKLSEEVSAIFNFTLDESYSVKRYYAKLLDYYKDESISDNRFLSKTTAKGNVAKKEAGYTLDVANANCTEEKEIETKGLSSTSNNRILASIHHVLADLYLSEENFSNAIFEYQKCSSLLSVSLKSLDWVSASLMLFYIRNTMKLCLAYEKRKTYDSAYFIYQELTETLLKYRYFNEFNYGLQYQNNEKVVDEKTKQIIRSNEVNAYLIKTHLHDMGDLISRLTLFEDVRFVYQVLLAKLLVSEKMEFGGITLAKMEETEAEFQFLCRLVDEKEKFAIIANFYREMGDIMYFKNGFLLYRMTWNKYENQQNQPKAESDEDNNVFKAWDLWNYSLEDTINTYLNKKIQHTLDNNHADDTTYFLIKEKIVMFFRLISETDLVDAISKSNCESIIQTYAGKYLKKRGETMDIIRPYIEEIFNHYIFAKDENSTQDGIIYDKVRGCKKRRDNCPSNQNYYPCYACKFYNKSLRLLIKNVFGTITDDKRTKVIVLWNNLSKAKTLPNEDTLTLIATILSSFGNVMLSCSDINDKISAQFLNAFFEAIKWAENKSVRDKATVGNHILEIFDAKENPSEKFDMSFLEKSILYFWVGSEYYSTSNSKEASYCHKKILQIFLNYFKVHEEFSDDDVVNSIDRKISLDYFLLMIKTNIIDRSIRYLYAQNDKINIAEIQDLKWMFSQNMYENIPLHLLSLFPDIEELLYSYLELQIVLNRFRQESVKINNDIQSIYGSQMFSSLAIDCTVSERIQSLRLKEQYNRMILGEMLQDRSGTCFINMDHHYASYLAPKAFYAGLQYYLSNKNPIERILEKLAMTDLLSQGSNERSEESRKIDFLVFLIRDSLFCLSKIIENVEALHDSTLFSNCFIAEAYQALFEWNEIFEFMYDIFRVNNCNGDETIQRKIQKDLYLFSKNRYTDELRCDAQIEILMNAETQSDALYQRFFIAIGADKCGMILFDSLTKKELEKNMQLFAELIKENATTSRVNFLSTNYSAEKAINRYRSAKELHMGGKTYKETISNMYLQNDDLNNDTCQFQYGIERYKINCGYLDKRMNDLKRAFSKSVIYDAQNYLKR